MRVQIELLTNSVNVPSTMFFRFLRPDIVLEDPATKVAFKSEGGR